MNATRPEGGTTPRSALPARTRALFLVLVSLLATVPAVGLVVTAGGEAEAHGTPMKPGSRTFLCRQDALTGTGEIKPVNPACKAAAQVSGTTPFYNWFSVLRSDGAGRTRGFVPDGQLCSGGNTGFTGFDTPGADWPLTREPGDPTGPVPGACTATRRTTGSWNGGHQSEVTVTNDGDVPMLGWMVDWTLPDGQRIDSLWSGTATYDGQDVMVHNAGCNGSLDPGESTTFGHVVSGPGGDGATSLPCRVG
ncbi:cellulose binding domain-containing protein [Streptomyces caelestis]|uniref:cellulose binding domain-containing protein n=1 Tax=Streptomyces caelestis TaxID=36816 RepID=UPI003649AD1D